MVNIDKYVKHLALLKESSIYTEEELICLVKEVFQNTLFKALVLDIDNTITTNDYIEDDMALVLNNVLKLNKQLIFITGRGTSSSLKFLSTLIDKINDSNLIKQITCYVNNGLYKLSSENDFLDRKQLLISENKFNQYIKNKNYLQRKCIDILSENVMDSKKEIRTISNHISGTSSLRFSFKKENTFSVNNVMEELTEFLGSHEVFEDYILTTGKHKNKTILEISVIDKYKAVENIMNENSFENIELLKIGDQGQEYGNDYSMLNGPSGFSVGAFSSKEKFIWPYINSQTGDSVLGIGATMKIVNDLIIEKEIE